MKVTSWAVAAALFGAPAVGAQGVTGDEIRAHLKIIADDRMEGRGTGAPGERRAASYIEEQFRSIGLQPANKGSFIQEVPVVGVTTDPSLILDMEGHGVKLAAKYYDDFSGGSGVVDESVPVHADIVFVGYGVSAPDQKWDDYKGTDVRGKILLMLVNDPPSDDPQHFGGRAMTYYGRWTYKYEEAARRGAGGALLIHTDELAGYPWQVVQKSWGGERFALEDRPDSLLINGWLRREIADKLFTAAGKNMQELIAAAARPDFAPVPLGMTLRAQIKNTVRHLTAPNVVGILPGSERTDRYIALIAHHDHFGIGKPDARGDTIYNGAADNATGVAAVIALARALKNVKPKDSIMFLTVTGEEQGLLGSAYYTMHPLVPLEKTTAAISLDGLNVWGRTSDIQALGAERSELGEMVSEVAKSDALSVSPDRFPEKGYFYRSDHFSFARAGVPGISVNCGASIIGKPAGWGEAKIVEFINQRYHQPSDEIQPDWDMGGIVEIAEYVMKLIDRIGADAQLVQWSAGSEFQRRK